MATYAIGDVQGCYSDLRRLLDKIGFDAAQDRVWLAGDLVNRGPESLQVVRFVRELGEAAVVVLGNHDLHLQAVAAGNLKYYRSDSVADILQAPDREELLHWLRNRPLLHHDAELGFTMVHAGLPPQWDLSLAQTCAMELETILRGPDRDTYFRRMYGNEPDCWSDQLQGWERARFITNCFSRLRFCDAAGRLALEEKGPPGSQPAHFMPWFKVPGRASAHLRIVFGHWSTLGVIAESNVYSLDAGCVWGGQLVALKLGKEPEWIRVNCAEHRKPS